jgi:hypothetical protein
LKAVCLNLRMVDSTFHAEKLLKPDPNQAGITIPRTAYALVHEFRLRPIFRCENIKEGYFDGIYYTPFQGGNPGQLYSLEDLGRWIIEGFLMCRKQKVQVEVARRCGRKYGRVTGTIVTLTEEKLKAAITMLKVMNGELPGPADVGACCPYPQLV